MLRVSGEAGRKENCKDGASQNALGPQGKSMGGRKNRKRREIHSKELWLQFKQEHFLLEDPLKP